MPRCISKMSGQEYDYATVVKCEPSTYKPGSYVYTLFDGSIFIDSYFYGFREGHIWVKDTFYSPSDFQNWFTPIDDRTMPIEDIVSIFKDRLETLENIITEYPTERDYEYRLKIRQRVHELTTIASLLGIYDEDLEEFK